MTLRDALALLLRRWYVVVAGLLVTVGLVLGASALVKPFYESSATTVLVPGPGTIAQGGNPLLFLGGLNQTRDVLVRKMQSGEIRGRLLDESGSDDLTVEVDTLINGPAILLRGLAPTAAAATETRDRALERLPVELNSLQDDVNAPADARVLSLVLTSDDEPRLNSRNTTRAMFATGLVGVGLTLSSAALIDSIMISRAGPTGRRSRRALREDARQAASAAETGRGAVSASKGDEEQRTEAGGHGLRLDDVARREVQYPTR